MENSILSLLTHVGTALIVEWLNVKIQNRMAPPSPTPNESSKEAGTSQNKEETYRFQVRFILTFNNDCSISKHCQTRFSALKRLNLAI